MLKTVVLVRKRRNGTAHGYLSNSAFLLPLLQVVSISGQPQQAYYKFREPEPWSAGGASLSWDRLCGTPSSCSMETGDDTAHFQATIQALSVPYLMCRRTEGTSTTARRCCGISRVCAGYKTADLLYLEDPTSQSFNWCKNLVFPTNCWALGRC